LLDRYVRTFGHGGQVVVHFQDAEGHVHDFVIEAVTGG
jgi:hypothetical protein